MATAVTSVDVSFPGSMPGKARIVVVTPTVAGMTTTRFEFNAVIPEGTIETIRIYYPNSGAADITFNMYTSDTAVATTNEHIFQVEEVTQCFQRCDLCIPWQNTDPLNANGSIPDLLYFEVDNTSTIPTGVIDLELYVQTLASG